MTPERAEREISNELDAGERILWAGAPPQGLFVRGHDAFLIPVSLLWGGFVVFWVAMAVSHNTPAFFWLWGVPFLAAAFYMVAGRFMVDASQRSRTAYGVTDRRIVIISGIFSRTLKSLPLRAMSDLTIRARPNGTGTIVFGPMHPMMHMYGTGWPGLGNVAVPMFDSIPRAKEVYATIRQAQERAR
ncbi:MAG TPA: PH domain-containing protein [Thermoanaerobaculia bacterium]|nr:PH domain-containing protein [Thermoanaerobaculia bacterium]